MKRFALVALIIVPMLLGAGLVGAALTNKTLVLQSTFGKSFIDNVPVDATLTVQTIQVPTEELPRVVVVIRQPGETSVELRVYEMSTDALVPVTATPICTTMSPVPGWVCVGSNNWVPPRHPLAGKR